MEDIKPEVLIRDFSYTRDRLSHDVEIYYPYNDKVMTITFDCDSSGAVSVLVWDDNQVKTLDKSALANRVTLDD